MKSHNASYATNLTNPGGGRAGAHHNVGSVNAAVAAGAMPQLNFANSNVVQGSRIQVSPTKIKTPSLNNSSSSGSNSQASGVVDLAGGGSVSVILQQGPDGQLTLIQQPASISSPGSSIVTGGSSNNTPVSNNSSPLQTSNTLTSLPFFNLTTSMQPTKPLGSKICRWVQVGFYHFLIGKLNERIKDLPQTRNYTGEILLLGRWNCMRKSLLKIRQSSKTRE